MLDADPRTLAVVICGEIGGSAEEEAAEYGAGMGKPVVAFVAGRASPPGRRWAMPAPLFPAGKATTTRNESAGDGRNRRRRCAERYSETAVGAPEGGGLDPAYIARTDR